MEGCALAAGSAYTTVCHGEATHMRVVCVCVCVGGNLLVSLQVLPLWVSSQLKPLTVWRLYLLQPPQLGGPNLILNTQI